MLITFYFYSIRLAAHSRKTLGVSVEPNYIPHTVKKPNLGKERQL